MPVDLILVVLGIAVRQVDRGWFSDLRRSRTIRQLFAWQRRRRNDVTPVLVVVGHWCEIAGYWLLCARPAPITVVVTAIAIAIKFRHLQEVSHFGIHGTLCRRRRVGDALIEVGAQAPLLLATIVDRRESHVRQHHPNATAAGADPNLVDLVTAGLHPGASWHEFLGGLLYPLTPKGVASTGRDLLQRSVLGGRPTRHRIAMIAIVGFLANLLGGAPAIVATLAARVLLYPQMAWFSLVVEHRWFADESRRGRPRTVEARRCIRIYPTRPWLALVLRGTLLPYGDLYHFAHSVYPGLRWNYLPAAERLIGLPEFAPTRILMGRSSLIAVLYRAVHGRAPAPIRASGTPVVSSIP